MKIIINSCFGGFGFSPLALSEYAKLVGKDCYFFDISGQKTEPLTIEQAEKSLFSTAYTVKNPEEYRIQERGEDGTYKDANKRAESIALYPDDYDIRTDANMIGVVEKLGEKANTRFSKLKVIEIPDGVEYQIDEYDGAESIHEIHRSWE